MIYLLADGLSSDNKVGAEAAAGNSVDGYLSSESLPPPNGGVDIDWIDFYAIADATRAFCGDDCASASQKRIQDDVISRGTIHERGEMIFVSLGLGQLLMMGRDLNDMSQVIAVMILIVAIGYIIDGLVFKTIEQRLQQKWGLTPVT